MNQSTKLSFSTHMNLSWTASGEILNGSLKSRLKTRSVSSKEVAFHVKLRELKLKPFDLCLSSAGMMYISIIEELRRDKLTFVFMG